MSELANMMINLTFLDVCKGIEGLCADMYHYYSRIYEDNPEASELWKKTALEEENHQLQFGLAMRLLYETEFEVMKDSLKHAKSIENSLQKFMEHIKAHKPDLLTAVSQAVEMEEKIAGLHVHTALTFRDGSVKRLFTALSDADHEHVAALQRYRTILSLPNSEMVAH